jgi:CO/xanthine dehydrogenase Mo-binding subunit
MNDSRSAHVIGSSVPKIDSLSLACGVCRFTMDFELRHPLFVAFAYSPYPHADIVSIDTEDATAMPGVIDILSYRNAPDRLHTTAGQGYPEPSPYDTRLFPKRVLCVGDRVAAVAAESREIAENAVKKLKIEYSQRNPLFDPEQAGEPESPKLHADDGSYAPLPVPYRPDENLVGEVLFSFGDCENGFSEADFVDECTYHTQYVQHCAMEPHAASASFDESGRLVIISTTQVPFHARRIVSKLTGIPVGRIRVVKPRVGGGFGSKQEVILEPVVALFALRTRRNVIAEFSRKEVFMNSRTRHPFRVRIKTGLKNDGTITALEMDDLMNAGAYGAHGLTVLSNGGSKVLPLLNKIPNVSFTGRTVYTNLPTGGAYRGYGATQGYFALNQQIDILARRLGVDVTDFVKAQHIREGETSEVFKAIGEGTEGVSQIIKSCRLSECIDTGAREIGWKEKRGKRLRNGDFVRGVGFAVAMQGSGIPLVDMGSAWMKMNDDGSVNLMVGATDIGTGSDTILAQIAAETLTLPMEKVIVLSSDTDLTPFDTGAYASSTTYISGKAVQLCSEKIREQILSIAAPMLECDATSLSLRAMSVVDIRTDRSVSFEDIACRATYTTNQAQIQATASFVADESPAPFIAQFAEVEVDIRTGTVRVLSFVSVADCGVALNPRMVEGQIEGATVNGISFALCEELLFDSSGRVTNPSFWDYKIYTAADVPPMKTIVLDSFEPTGPFGAKSIAEIGINGPAPAIANAIFDAIGIRMFDLPMTPEKVLREIGRRGVS